MTTIKLRRGTSSQWAAANPVLSYGEPGWERDTGIIKMGDGITAWLDLEPFAGAGGGGSEPGGYVPSFTNRSLETVEDGPLWRTDLTDAVQTTFSNLAEHWVGGKLRSWLNEWGALRGRNPYSSFADSLVRAIIEAGDYVSNGNFIELVDRRIEANSPKRQVYGRRWADGRLIRNGIPFVDTYYHAGDPATIPWDDLPVPCMIIAVADGLNNQAYLWDGYTLHPLIPPLPPV